MIREKMAHFHQNSSQDTAAIVNDSNGNNSILLIETKNEYDLLLQAHFKVRLINNLN